MWVLGVRQGHFLGIFGVFWAHEAVILRFDNLII